MFINKRFWAWTYPKSYQTVPRLTGNAVLTFLEYLRHAPATIRLLDITELKQLPKKHDHESTLSRHSCNSGMRSSQQMQQEAQFIKFFLANPWASF